VYFIDIENMPYVVNQINREVFTRENSNVFIVKSQRSQVSIPLGIPYYVVQSGAKNAADNAICFFTGRLVIDNPKLKKVYIITKDGFVANLQEMVSELDVSIIQTYKKIQKLFKPPPQVHHNHSDP
jgi:hypothetical protein